MTVSYVAHTHPVISFLGRRCNMDTIADITFQNFLTFLPKIIKCPWPNNNKMSDLATASRLNLQSSFLLFHKTHKFEQISLLHWVKMLLRSQWQQMFLLAFIGIKSPILNYLEFPGLFLLLLFPALEECFFLARHFLTCGNSG